VSSVGAIPTLQVFPTSSCSQPQAAKLLPAQTQQPHLLTGHTVVRIFPKCSNSTRSVTLADTFNNHGDHSSIVNQLIYWFARSAIQWQPLYLLPHTDQGNTLPCSFVCRIHCISRFGGISPAVVLAQFSNHSSKHSSGATAIILHSTERKDARIQT